MNKSLYEPPAIVSEATTQGEIFCQKSAEDLHMSVFQHVSFALKSGIITIREARKTARKIAPNLFTQM